MSETVSAYANLTELRAAHAELLRRYRDGVTPALVADVRSFLQRGQATGALIDDPDSRWTAQGLFDYWVATLYRVGEEPLSANLDEFDPAQAPALPEAARPYRGLDAFGETDAKLFFGRRRVIDQLIAHLAEQRLLVVVGPSGSGKSSLVRAGLLPALREDALPGSAAWRYLPPLVPGSAPTEALERALVQAPPDDTAPLVLVVDQFEETFTLCTDPQQREAFIERLLTLVDDPHARNLVILTMRSDFEPAVTRSDALEPRFAAARFALPPFSAAKLRDAIEQPAERAGLKFEPGVVDFLLHDLLGEPAALPLLQFTLLKLWESRERNRVTLTTYQHSGGGRLALARSADALYNSLIPEEQVTARRILLRMVRPGEGLEVTSNRIRRAELYRGGEDPGRVDRVLQRLADARLVRETQSDSPEDTQVEVAHEALVRNWPTLVDWIDTERVALRQRQRLTAAAEEWDRLERDPGALLGGARLVEARAYEWAMRDGKPVAEPIIVSYAGGAITSLVFSPDGDKLLSLDVLGERDHYPLDREAERGTGSARLLDLEALAANPAGYQPLVLGETNQLLLSAAISPDGRWAAAGSAVLYSQQAPLPADNAVMLWDLSVRQPAASLQLLRGHTDAVSLVRFNPDSQSLASASNDTTIRLWDLKATPVAMQQPRVLRGHDEQILALAYNRDGRRLVSGSSDTSARLWTIGAGAESAEPRVLRGHSDRVTAVAFSPDDAQVFTVGLDGTGRLWALEPRVLTELACANAGRNLSLGEWEQAFGDEPYRKTCPALTIHPSYPAAAREVARSGDVERTLEMFAHALALAPELKLNPQVDVGSLAAPTIYDEGLRLARQGDYDGALAKFLYAKQLDSALETNPLTDARRETTGGLWAIGRALIIDGEVEAGIAQMRKAASLWPQDTTVEQATAAALIELGDNLAEQRDLAGATATYERAKQLDPTLKLDARAKAIDIIAARNFADAYQLIDEGQIEVGLALLRKNFDLRAPEGTTFEQVAALALASGARNIVSNGGDLARATEFARRVAAFDPDLGASLVEAINKFSQGRAAILSGDDQRGLQLLREALDRDPQLSSNSPGELVAAVLGSEGRKLAEAGQAGAAPLLLRAYELAPSSKELGPELPVAANMLVLAKARATPELVDAALALASKATARYPAWPAEAAELLNTVCWFGSLHGRAVEALLYCDAAVALAPDNAAYIDSRGVARARTGKPELATGAINDFRYFINNWSDQSSWKEQRERWIAALARGEPPFTESDVMELFDQ